MNFCEICKEEIKEDDKNVTMQLDGYYHDKCLCDLESNIKEVNFNYMRRQYA